MYLVWLTNPTSCCACLTVIDTVPPHGQVSPLTAFLDQRWQARSCLKHPLWPGVAAAVAHLWQRFHGACDSVSPLLHRQNHCTGQQDRRLVFLSLHRGQITCAQWLTDAWAQPGNRCNPGGADRGNCLCPQPHTFLRQAPRNKASAGKALERKWLKQYSGQLHWVF